MKLTSKRFSAEDFKDQTWIEPLLSGLNTLLQELQTINTNQVTIADNLNQEILETKFLNDAVAFPMRIKTKFATTPKGLSCIYCIATDGTTASNTPWLTWSFANQLLTIDSMTNLTSGKTYTIRLHLVYG
jgi:hypothetical protein